MSGDFFMVAKEEIQAELSALAKIALNCVNDEDILKNSKAIEMHLHKIKGLAPMMGQEKLGEIAKTADTVMKHIIEHGSLAGSDSFILEIIESMKDIFKGQSSKIVDFSKRAREKFPQISIW
jgi:chemotaxis protein histidine kinase CheA